jgi:hypothetical protein
VPAGPRPEVPGTELDVKRPPPLSREAAFQPRTCRLDGGSCPLERAGRDAADDAVFAQVAAEVDVADRVVVA